MREKCAVVGLYSDDVEKGPLYVYQMLRSLQHRGQDGSGMALSHPGLNSGEPFRHAKKGLVVDVYPPEILNLLSGNLLIGHNRYGTEGDVDGEKGEENLQPCVIENRQYLVHLGFNGTIPYYDRLSQKISSKCRLKTNVDTEGLGYLLSEFLLETGDIFEANRRLMEIVPGAYSYTALIYDKDKKRCQLVGARDSYGVRPLIFSVADGKKIIASESVALNKLKIRDFRDFAPGEVIAIEEDGRFDSRIVAESKLKICLFEYSYFSSAVSKLEGRNVGEFRFKVGEMLAEMYPVRVDFVVPTPDSGRLAAEGYAARSGLPLVSAIVRDPSSQRTFIVPPARIDNEVSQKYFYNPSIIRGKRIVVIDDSSVRGKTMKEIVRNCKEIGGAAEVHVRLAYPPIYGECDWGIAFRHQKELTAAPYFIDNPSISPDKYLTNFDVTFAGLIGADSAGFISIGKAEEALQLKEKVCLGCTARKKPFAVTTY